MNNIILVGPMGSGKSVVGKQLAKKMHKSFVDTDQIIEQKMGVNISWIFDYEGEDGFRQREFKVFSEAINEDNNVIATGGGIVTVPSNRTYMKEHASIIIYLKPSLETLYRRLSITTNRPLLNQSKNREETIRTLYQERDPLYQEVADITIEKTHHSIGKQVGAIMRAIADV